MYNKLLQQYSLFTFYQLSTMGREFIEVKRAKVDLDNYGPTKFYGLYY